jgi:hypothetical protein
MGAPRESVYLVLRIEAGKTAEVMSAIHDMKVYDYRDGAVEYIKARNSEDYDVKYSDWVVVEAYYPTDDDD